MKKTTYKQPTLKVVAFKSEQGFATSGVGLFSIASSGTGLEFLSLMDNDSDSDLEILDIDNNTYGTTFWE